MYTQNLPISVTIKAVDWVSKPSTLRVKYSTWNYTNGLYTYICYKGEKEVMLVPSQIYLPWSPRQWSLQQGKASSGAESCWLIQGLAPVARCVCSTCTNQGSCCLHQVGTLLTANQNTPYSQPIKTHPTHSQSKHNNQSTGKLAAT